MFRSIKKGWKRAAQFVTETTGKVVQYVGDKLVAIVGGTALTASNAMAAVPSSVTDGISAAITDIGIIGAAVMGVAIAIAAFFWIKRPLGHN